MLAHPNFRKAILLKLLLGGSKEPILFKHGFFVLLGREDIHLYEVRG